MALIHRQGTNLMATLCGDAERCSRRSLQINQQCNLCLNQRLIKRLRAEQSQIALRLRELQKLIAGMDREFVADPLAWDFANEVARRAIVKIRSSVN
ncbi:hypothetical protein [Synechococcus sp. UW179A]|uniref:hypothetical protein n=1 Tax=Synechococcus sp. UW179A TaxID=2575510 RepID=UPI000E0FA2EB|nr:hypothetical protein [Synechococcus sp. UW179A]